MGSSKALPTHYVPNFRAWNDSSPHQLRVPWVFGRTSRGPHLRFGAGASVADLARSKPIETVHLAEAIHLRLATADATDPVICVH